jgi:hypothetical protein
MYSPAKSLASWNVFSSKVASAGLEPRDCGNGHWQVLGGERTVNFWPRAKEGPKIHAKGMSHGKQVQSLEEVIQAAGKLPKQKITKVPEKLNKSLRQKTLKVCKKALEFFQDDSELSYEEIERLATDLQNIVQELERC